MTRRKLTLILSTTLLAALAGVLFFGFTCLGWGFGPQLTDIEVGMTHDEVLELLPGVDMMDSFWANRMIYFHGSQRAFVIFDHHNNKILSYAVFNQLRQPLKVDFSVSSIPNEMVSSSLIVADFHASTLFQLMDQYRFHYSTRSDIGHSQSLLLDNGLVLYISGPTVWTCESYNAFEQNHIGAFGFLQYNDQLSIIGDTYLRLVTAWDIFQFEPGMDWNELVETTIFEEPTETVDQRNSDYFLRWLQEHVPEGMTRQEVDRWIEDFRAGSEQE